MCRCQIELLYHVNLKMLWRVQRFRALSTTILKEIVMMLNVGLAPCGVTLCALRHARPRRASPDGSAVLFCSL
jgi:hypothetical protein